MTTYLFPGQGSQIRGMGKDLFAEFPELVKEANNILGYDLPTLCINDPDEKLNQTQYTQPALFVVNALAYLNKQKLGAPKPNFVMGHSLGEYNALCAAEVFDFNTGLNLVKKRGELMSQINGGGMAAIIGLSALQIENILQQKALNATTIANYNSYTQIVISGLKSQIDQSIPLFENTGAMLAVPLKVSGAFHSPYMKDAEQLFANYVNHLTFQSPTIPVIANINATPYAATDLKTNLIKQITHPVRWTHSIEYVLKLGEDSFEEIGPGNILKNLVQRIQNGK